MSCGIWNITTFFRPQVHEIIHPVSAVQKRGEEKLCTFLFQQMRRTGYEITLRILIGKVT